MQCKAVFEQYQTRLTKDCFEFASVSSILNLVRSIYCNIYYLPNCLHKKLGKEFDLFQGL